MATGLSRNSHTSMTSTRRSASSRSRKRFQGAKIQNRRLTGLKLKMITRKRMRRKRTKMKIKIKRMMICQRKRGTIRKLLRSGTISRK